MRDLQEEIMRREARKFSLKQNGEPIHRRSFRHIGCVFTWLRTTTKMKKAQILTETREGNQVNERTEEDRLMDEITERHG